MKKLFILLFIHLNIGFISKAQEDNKNYHSLALTDDPKNDQIVYFHQYGTKLMKVDKEKSIINLNSPSSKVHAFKSIRIFPEDLKINSFNVHLMSDHLFDNDDELEFLLAYNNPRNDSVKIDLFKTSNNGASYTTKNLALGKGDYNIEVKQNQQNNNLKITLGKNRFHYNMDNLSKSSLSSSSSNESFGFVNIESDKIIFPNPFNSRNGKVQIYLFSNNGNLIKSQTQSGRNTKISFKRKKLSSGKYICQIRNKFGIVQTYYFKILK